MPKSPAEQGKQPAPQVQVSVSIEEAYLDRFLEVVQRAIAVGLHLNLALETIGVLLGTIDETKIAELRKVRGIAHVEGERKYQLTPPHSRVQ